MYAFIWWQRPQKVVLSENLSKPAEITRKEMIQKTSKTFIALR
jgi:hypothetical protein